MSRFRHKVPKLLDHRLEYIDPVDCHSAVGYTIATTSYGGFSASVELINCDRKITWEFDNTDLRDHQRCLAKLDKAVDMLLAFRNSYNTHGAAFIAKRKKGKKK